MSSFYYATSPVAFNPRVHTLETATTTKTKAPDVLPGVICCLEGWFSDERGQFTEASLVSIVSAMRTNDGREGGTKCLLGHGADAGMLVGRLRKPRLSTATADEVGVLKCVRADLHFAPAARVSPFGDLVEYVTSVAEVDVRALMMSLVIRSKQIPVPGEPPVWLAESIAGCDLVHEGAATTSLLAHRPVNRRQAFQRMRWECAMLSAQKYLP